MSSVAGGVLAMAAMPALALAPDGVSDALAKLEQGRWQIRSASQAAPTHSICLGDRALLLQIEHGSASCSRDVVQATATGVTADYTCPGRGFGHTTIRVETSRAATIETQGLINGRPFAYRANARKLSDC